MDATSCLYSFFDGDPRTAHVDAEGKPFWDTSFGPPNMGCPFAIDYRWFYRMLKVASNADKHTSRPIPVVSFIHWHTTAPPEPPNPGVQQMSESAYQELLWQMLLRGTDTFFMWCMPPEQAKEIKLVHPVWAAAQEYGEFLERGIPVCFDVP